MRIGAETIYYEKVSSSNTIAAELLKKGKASHGTVISAGFQTAGKGQRSNTWQSDALMNLTMSVILKPDTLTPDQQFYISKIVSLAVIETLSRYSSEFSIKWPNDIYHKSDKIAGILIEHTIIGNTISGSIAGIGINVNQDEFPDDLLNPVSLKNITSNTSPVHELQESIYKNLDRWYSIMSNGELSAIDNGYRDNLYLLGIESVFSSGGDEFRGTISGVNDSGQLVVSQENGKSRQFSFKEIEFIR